MQGLRLAQAVGRWVCNPAARVQFLLPAAVSLHGSVVLTPVDLIIDRTKKTSICAEIAETITERHVKTQQSSSSSNLCMRQAETWQGTHGTGKTGKMAKKIPVRENTGNLEIQFEWVPCLAFPISAAEGGMF